MLREGDGNRYVLLNYCRFEELVSLDKMESKVKMAVLKASSFISFQHSGSMAPPHELGAWMEQG